MAPDNGAKGGERPDVLLIGTGTAPLVAAYDLLAQGASVVIVNPELDFFLENAELSLDPWIPWGTGSASAEELIGRVKAGMLDPVLASLRPVFPGSVEAWPPGKAEGYGYHDPKAPFVRARGRLWLVTDSEQQALWARLEDLFVGLHDAGLNPQILEGVSAIKRFPGCNSGGREGQGIWVPRVADVDLARFRVGLLEFVRERLGDGGVICAASQMEWTEQGLRFHAKGHVRLLAPRQAMVFWTPKLQGWIQSQAKALRLKIAQPTGVRLWEEWVLNSREALDPAVAGIWNDCVVWADGEGAPELAGASAPAPTRARVLRPVGAEAGGWASSESFHSLHRLCQEFLRWEKVGVHRMDAQSTLLWEPGVAAAEARVGGTLLWLVPGADGPLSALVPRVRDSVAGLGAAGGDP